MSERQHWNDREETTRQLIRDAVAKEFEIKDLHNEFINGNSLYDILEITITETTASRDRELRNIFSGADVAFHDLSHKTGEGKETKLVRVKHAGITITKEKWDELQSLLSDSKTKKEEYEDANALVENFINALEAEAQAQYEGEQRAEEEYIAEQEHGY